MPASNAGPKRDTASNAGLPAYLRTIFVEPFAIHPEDVLTKPRQELERERRSGLLRLTLSSVALVLIVPVIPAALLTRALPLFNFTLFAELALAGVCLLINRTSHIAIAGALFVYGSLVLGADFALRDPNGLDIQGLLLYSILALVVLIAGLVLPVWVIWLSAAPLIAVTIIGVLVTPLSTTLQANGHETAVRLGAVVLLVANQALSAAFSWMYARSARAGVEGAVRAAERERELTALKDQFLIDANHELRTPIMSWYNNMELLRRLGERASPEQRARILSRAFSSGDAVLRILSTMLDPSVTGSGAPSLHPTAIALAPLVRSVLETFDPHEIAEPGLEDVSYSARPVSVEIPDDIFVWADENRLRQIFINLLTNALKYSESGTPIAISARFERPKRVSGWLRMPGTEDSSPPEPELVRIGVRDQGLGVPPREARLLFNRFVRLERDIAGPVRGTGVGLYLCRTLTEAMGGRIWVESAGIPGEGSTFLFTLPCPERTALAPTPAGSPSLRSVP